MSAVSLGCVGAPQIIASSLRTGTGIAGGAGSCQDGYKVCIAFDVEGSSSMRYI